MDARNFKAAFGLTEVIIALLLLTMVGVGVVQLSTGFFKGAKSAQSLSDVDTLNTELTLFFQENAHCNLALSGKVIKPGSSLLLTNELQYSPTQSLAKAGQKLSSGAIIKKIEIRNVVAVKTGTLYRADVGVDITPSTQTSGTLEVSRRVPVYLQTTPSGSGFQVTGCQAPAAGPSPKDICEKNLGGSYNTALTPPCTLPAPPAPDPATVCASLGGTFSYYTTPFCKVP